MEVGSWGLMPRLTGRIKYFLGAELFILMSSVKFGFLRLPRNAPDPWLLICFVTQMYTWYTIGHQVKSPVRFCYDRTIGEIRNGQGNRQIFQDIAWTLHPLPATCIGSHHTPCHTFFSLSIIRLKCSMLSCLCFCSHLLIHFTTMYWAPAMCGILCLKLELWQWIEQMLSWLEILFVLPIFIPTILQELTPSCPIVCTSLSLTQPSGPLLAFNYFLIGMPFIWLSS